MRLPVLLRSLFLPHTTPPWSVLSFLSPCRVQWPARVDLLIRSYLSENFFILQFLFDSLDLLWPKGIGDVVLVLDEGEQQLSHIVPHWVKVRGENKEGAGGGYRVIAALGA